MDIFGDVPELIIDGLKLNYVNAMILCLCKERGYLTCTV